MWIKKTISTCNPPLEATAAAYCTMSFLFYDLHFEAHAAFLKLMCRCEQIFFNDAVLLQHMSTCAQNSNANVFELAALG